MTDKQEHSPLPITHEDAMKHLSEDAAYLESKGLCIGSLRAGRRHIAALLAENKRLREALESAPIISMYHGHNGFNYTQFADDYAAWRTVARAALQGEQP